MDAFLGSFLELALPVTTPVLAGICAPMIRIILVGATASAVLQIIRLLRLIIFRVVADMIHGYYRITSSVKLGSVSACYAGAVHKRVASEALAVFVGKPSGQATITVQGWYWR